MIQTIDGKFSYYLKPITNVDPCKTVNLERIYKFISEGKLNPLTLQVRSGKRLKTKVLPFITASGVFEKRSMDHLISYSGIVGIDLDDIDTAIKSKLFADPFLNPALLFISPSNKGIKLFVRVQDSISIRHDQYFNAISMYLFGAYGVSSDPACRDISRACFLCHDADALYSSCGSVLSSDLIDLISLLQPSPVTDAIHPVSAVVTNTCSKKSLQSTANPFHQNANDLSYICSKLNSSYAVYNYACTLLKLNGWSQSRTCGIYWFRPGKEFKDGHSAVFTFYNPYGIYLFTNYTSSSVHLAINKSYTLCSLISIIGFDSDFVRCISDLSSLFKNSI